ncbi:GyrI-like domain-containing protein [Labilibaculum sp.]|uniref:GyrI-like domain-containing protein n=1 Tax=Labilibaculum sp. TaxID=2060723 RepID=UPI0035619B12
MLNRIEIIDEKTLVGKNMKMSLTNNKTSELWKSFMQERNQIKHRINSDFISLQNYPDGYFDSFNPNTEFEKWACVEVAKLDYLPEGMRTFKINAGEFAVFTHKGSNADPSIFKFIYSDWLPNSDYELRDEPHFEILGVKYKNNDPCSEEEIWIPIVKKKA